MSCSSSLLIFAVNLQYLHNEAYDGWKSGGYPRYSIIHQRYLARTLTCSQYLKDWLHEHGHYNPARVSVVKLGVDKAKFNAVSSTGRADAKSRLLGLEPSTIVITIVGRVDPQKRPLLVPDVVERLLEIIGEDFVILLIGEGPSLFNLRATVQRKKLEDYVITLGAKTNVHEYLEATDIFFLPSLSEGISIAVSEAMAMGLPIVTAAAGALPEQLGRDSGRQWGGVLVEHTLEHAQDVKLYAEALADLIRDAPARLSLGSHARRLLEDEDDWRQTLAALFEETKIAENLPGHASGQSDYPNPAGKVIHRMALRMKLTPSLQFTLRLRPCYKKIGPRPTWLEAVSGKRCIIFVWIRADTRLLYSDPNWGH